jgi:hypothetical protein
MFAPKRTKPRIWVQIFEMRSCAAFGDKKGPDIAAGALKLM